MNTEISEAAETRLQEDRVRVFISYSSEDVDFVDRLRSKLEGAGFSTWVDRDRIEGGEEWTAAISAAMVSSAVVLFVISPDAVKSSWVSKEISFACRRQMPVIPVICRNTDLPVTLDWLVGGAQRLDLSGAQFASGVEALTHALRNLDDGRSPRDNGATASATDIDVHLEDILEFARRVPARMIWRLSRLNHLSLPESVFRTLAFTTPRIVPTFLFWLAFYAAMVWLGNVMFPLPDHEIVDILFPNRVQEDIAFIFVGAAGMTLLQLLANIVRNQLLKRALPKAFPDLSYRPRPETPNQLLDRWDASVKPIVWQLLDEPHTQWVNYLEKRVTDEELRSRVFISLAFLLGVSSD